MVLVAGPRYWTPTRVFVRCVFSDYW